jgi:predicted anti-sigma-YlaC factor YlaD
LGKINFLQSNKSIAGCNKIKVFCKIIKDLLPLYYDGVCSDGSREMIKKHLLECDSCKAELQVMDEVLPITNQEQNLIEANAVKNLSKKWEKGMLKSLLKGLFMTLLILIVFAIVLYLFVDVKIG